MDTQAERLRAVENREPYVAHNGNPNGVLTAGEGVFCYDYANQKMYFNIDGLTTWKEIVTV